MDEATNKFNIVFLSTQRGLVFSRAELTENIAYKEIQRLPMETFVIQSVPSWIQLSKLPDFYKRIRSVQISKDGKTSAHSSSLSQFFFMNLVKNQLLESFSDNAYLYLFTWRLFFCSILFKIRVNRINIMWQWFDQLTILLLLHLFLSSPMWQENCSFRRRRKSSLVFLRENFNFEPIDNFSMDSWRNHQCFELSNIRNRYCLIQYSSNLQTHRTKWIERTRKWRRSVFKVLY